MHKAIYVHLCVVASETYIVNANKDLRHVNTKYKRDLYPPLFRR